MALSNSSLISFTFARFGSTSFATFEYVSIACVHMHRDFAAFDWFPTTSGWYSGFTTNFSSFCRIFAAMLSLSKLFSRSMNPVSFNTFFAPSQSVFSPNSVFTASIVISTSGGGLAKDLISWMSFLSSEFKAFMALFSAGIAMSRSRCASALIWATSSAFLRTIASSAPTRSFTTPAFFCSSFTTGIRASASFVFCAINGCFRVNSSCRFSTISFASLIFCTPVERRFRLMFFSFFFSSSISRYSEIRSR
mmetsp:Transcript_15678/g.38833  ORF Transcript_15678/g.38833 Transcript_15678/m.38833 type:complete len:250 (-) Transcript_15678:3327-4076(-)